jgi:ATP-dependent DNA helicase RecQ
LTAPKPIDWGPLRSQARRRFAVTHFRAGQREIIEGVLTGEDVLGILPTGAGKSLCFQLPALFLDGLTVVVSPLIALLQDQLEHLDEADIEAARLDSTVSQHQERVLERDIRKGENDIVLLTPERLANPIHLDPLRKRRVALFVVDEAHCVSQWGHDFRPAYLHLRHVIQILGHPPVLALTATAPPDLVGDILEGLGIPRARVVRTGIDRENLRFEVLNSVTEEEKRDHLLQILAEVAGPVIVYASTVRQVEDLHSWLGAQQPGVVRYHGRMKLSERTAAQREFMSGDSRLIIATNAFGLGVDKPDVRAVVHWSFPASLETYYQEAGRAGRDGEPARCVLLYRLEDKKTWTFLLGGRYPRPRDVVRVLEALAGTASAEDAWITSTQLANSAGVSARRASVIIALLDSAELLLRQGTQLRLKRRVEADERAALANSYQARHEADRERLGSMMRYAQSVLCRMQFMREYFGEQVGEPCGRCDNCNKPEEALTRRVPSPARVNPTGRMAATVRAASRLARGCNVRHEKFGVGEIVDIHGDQVTVAFIRNGRRDVLASYLHPLD